MHMHMLQTMFYYLLPRCLLFLLIISGGSTQQANTCAALKTKLTKYHVHVKYLPEKTYSPLRLCQTYVNTTCCPQLYADQIQNATVIELYQLFELHSMNLYEPLLRLTQDFNDTYVKLIENSRNDTHQVLQRGYHQLYLSYRSSVDRFFNNLLTLTSRTYPHEIKMHVDQLFREILQISLTLNNNQSILPTYLSCLWRNQPFGSSPSLLVKQLDGYLGKLFQLNELLRLSHELVQVLSTGVTTDYHCIDSYMQLSYCNLCAGRADLPCLPNCIHVIESCLVNISMIDDVWRTFIDATEHVEYFNGIEKVLSSIGLSISDAVMTFLNSGGVQNKEIINQCGRIRMRRQTFAMDQRVDDESTRSFLDRQLMYISQTLQSQRFFWRRLPEQICRSRGLAASNGTTCWTGTALNEDGRLTTRPASYDKPLSLKLQWILKEMKEKSYTIGSMRRTTPALSLNPSTSTPTVIDSKINLIMQNLTDPLKAHELEDYPNDNDFDYSDYAYEDSTDQTSTTTTTTTTTTTFALTTTTIRTTTTEELSIDDTQTAYYDYGDHDVYSDDEVEETSTTTSTTKVSVRTISTTMTTSTTVSNWKERIPYYHRRPPIIWNVNINGDDNDDEQAQDVNSGSSLTYSLLLPLFIWLVRV